MRVAEVTFKSYRSTPLQKEVVLLGNYKTEVAKEESVLFPLLVRFDVAQPPFGYLLLRQKKRLLQQ